MAATARLGKCVLAKEVHHVYKVLQHSESHLVFSYLLLLLSKLCQWIVYICINPCVYSLIFFYFKDTSLF